MVESNGKVQMKDNEGVFSLGVHELDVTKIELSIQAGGSIRISRILKKSPVVVILDKNGIKIGGKQWKIVQNVRRTVYLRKRTKKLKLIPS